ncbi:hypothetical protein ACHAWF_008976 [Thalassiosira exigua]
MKVFSAIVLLTGAAVGSVTGTSTEYQLVADGCSSENPCGTCVGHCTSTEDCLADHECVDTGDNNAARRMGGCVGLALPGFSYCWDPESSFSVLPKVNEGDIEIQEPEEEMNCDEGDGPCDECVGDCDTDEGCNGSLICLQRNEGEAIPGCYGKVHNQKDFCVDPAKVGSDQQQLGETVFEKRSSQIMAEFSVPKDACSPDTPCDMCQADCDTHDDCAGDLVCLSRDAAEYVPFCYGSAVDSRDYCVERFVTFFPKTNESDIQFGKHNFLDDDMTCTGPDGACLPCEGDCDFDADCSEGFACFQRNDNEPVPGCYGLAGKFWDYCAPEDVVPPLPTMDFDKTAGSDVEFAQEKACKPEDKCGLCQNDCDTDEDCEDGLVCLQRAANEPVPGCWGAAVESRDYCTKADYGTDPGTAPASPSSAPKPEGAPSSAPAMNGHIISMTLFAAAAITIL